MDNLKYSSTALNSLMAFLEKQVDKDTDEYNIFHSFVELQKKCFEEENNSDSPFLSVITRTQGKRPDMLLETLMCLCGQSDTDFELIIVGHNLNDEQYATVSEMIDNLPEWMKKQTRYLPVIGGTRTTPLNMGFDAAKGKYIAILDDDDIVFDNWVQKFKEHYKIAPGKILHAYSFFQDWETVSEKYSNTPIPVKAPKDIFCRDFIFQSQININVCPPVGLAFPAYAFKKLNIRFDETLTTTEDWDFLMRTAFITGVENIPTPTSIYRNWLNTENSHTLHSKKEWKDNYNKLVDRFASIPAVIDESTIKTMIYPSINHNAAPIEVSSAELYYDDGSGFNASKVLIPLKKVYKKWACAFDLSKIEKVYSIRIDPCQNGCVTAENISVMLEFDDGTNQTYKQNAFITNGYKFNNSIVFLKDDPQIILPLVFHKKIKRVYFNIDISHKISDEAFDAILGKKNIFYRIAKKVYRLLRKIGRLLKR